MKIAITSKGETMDSPVDPRFGRAAGFVVYDVDTAEMTYVSNSTNANAAQGAGIQAAKTVADAGVEALITGFCGPKAFTALKAADIKVYSGSEGTVKETIDKFAAGGFSETQEANVEGHW